MIGPSTPPYQVMQILLVALASKPIWLHLFSAVRRPLSIAEDSHVGNCKVLNGMRTEIIFHYLFSPNKHVIVQDIE